VKKASSKHNRINSLVDCAPKTLLPLLAVSGGLAVGPAAAIELGDATVQSQLGQPLRASIAFALAPQEQVSESCISLGPGPSGLPGIGRASISIFDGALLLRGSTPIREPIVATNIVISCPSAARLAREYMMFIDPAGTTAAEPVVVAQPAVAARPAAVPAKAPSSAASNRRSTSTISPGAIAPRAVNNSKSEPIGMATRYRVLPGDSLSEITARIKNRPPGLWAAVNTVFNANPDAFIDNDPNKLKAGSWLTIPSFDGSEPIIGKAARTTAAAVVADTWPAINVAEVAATTSPAVTSQPVEPQAAQPPVPVVDTTTDLRPADPNSGNDNAATFAEVAANESIDIPDTALPGPETLSTSPNVTTAAVQPRAEQATSSWVLWLAGSGVAIILALLLFGRGLRNRFGPASDYLHSELPVRDASPESDALELRDDVDYHVDENEATIECATLDADLLMGTGLNQTIDVDPAEDVGFPSPTQVDIELPFATELETADDANRNYAASRTAESTILDSEILPESDDYHDPQDFDMSVILDATKMPQPEDITDSALEAIEMDSQTDTVATIQLDDELTANSTIDLTILEQDYEDELSATQSLHMDVTQAALMMSAEMASGVDAATSDDDSADDDTAAMILNDITLEDGENHDAAENDDMAITQKDMEAMKLELFADDETVEMPMSDDEKTRQMPANRAKLKKKAG
jgi:hypothetical protein